MTDSPAAATSASAGLKTLWLDLESSPPQAALSSNARTAQAPSHATPYCTDGNWSNWRHLKQGWWLPTPCLGHFVHNRTPLECKPESWWTCNVCEPQTTEKSRVMPVKPLTGSRVSKSSNWCRARTIDGGNGGGGNSSKGSASNGFRRLEVCTRANGAKSASFNWESGFESSNSCKRAKWSAPTAKLLMRSLICHQCYC